MRKPKIENKYNLKRSDFKRFKVIDLEKLKTRCWRNNVISAWCYSKGFGKGFYGESKSDIWVGFYDNGKVGVTCSCMEGMCNYIFENFYDFKKIDNGYDLQSQEALLEFANWLLDEKVAVLKGEENERI